MFLTVAAPGGGLGERPPNTKFLELREWESIRKNLKFSLNFSNLKQNFLKTFKNFLKAFKIFN